MGGGLIFFHEGLGFFGRGWDLVRLFEVVSVMVKQFSRGWGRGKNFSGRLRFFREGFKLFVEGWN